MVRYSLTALFILCFSFLGSINSSVEAQSSGSRSIPKGGGKQTIAKPLPDDDSRRSNEARLAFSIQLVSSLADEARSYKDDSLRVKVQARAADVLWDVEPERARTLFERAWDVAQNVDKEGRRRNQEERRRFLSGQGGTGFIPPPPNLRAEVLRLTSIHDRALAESFLAKLEE